MPAVSSSIWIPKTTSVWILAGARTGRGLFNITPGKGGVGADGRSIPAMSRFAGDSKESSVRFLAGGRIVDVVDKDDVGPTLWTVGAVSRSMCVCEETSGGFAADRVDDGIKATSDEDDAGPDR